MTILMGWESVLILMLLGGAVAVDGTSFGQFMVSRPFVSATLAGWIVGDPLHGAAIGVVLEAFHLAVLPVGAAKYPEGGPAAVAAGAVYATSDLASSTLLVIVLFAIAAEWVGGKTVQALRQANVRLIVTRDGERLTATRLERRHLAAIGLDFGRGMLLVGAVIPVMIAVVHVLVPLWSLSESLAGLVLTGLVAGLFASALQIVGSRLWFAAAGAAVTLLLLAV